jgi:hypothetical protein
MLAAADLLRLACSPDLIGGGIAYACRSLAYPSERLPASAFNSLRRTVAAVAVELAFRRLLDSQGVPFGILGATPFSDPDHYALTLGGRRCEVVSTLLSHRRQIASIRTDPGTLLQAPALLPLEDYTAREWSPDDLFLFAFMLGLVAPGLADSQRALAAGQPAWFIHPMPARWAQPSPWLPLDGLVLKNESGQALTLELGGQDGERRFITHTLEVPAGIRLPVPAGFSSLTHLHTSLPPAARLGLHCARLGPAHIVQPTDWGNLWVYGMDIFLAGWITREEFRRKAILLPAGQATFQFARTRKKNLALSLTDLNPLSTLLDGRV